MNKEKEKILIPIIRKVYPKMLAAQITGVQPMGPGVGGLFDADQNAKWSEWRRTISLWPRRSITGKIIIGWINKSSRSDWGSPYRYRPLNSRKLKRIRRFATDKELFTAKLKGEA